MNKNQSDLPDTKKDEAQLKPDTGTLNLPDVEDIPGQENIHPPDLREMADTTIASDDEEGIGVFETDNERFTRNPTEEYLEPDSAQEAAFEEKRPLPKDEATNTQEITKEAEEALANRIC